MKPCKKEWKDNGGVKEMDMLVDFIGKQPWYTYIRHQQPTSYTATAILRFCKEWFKVDGVNSFQVDFNSCRFGVLHTLCTTEDDI